MDSEFPGVIDLNVSGTHFRTLLSTLTKDEDSELAAMFTGRSPVYKDKDGRYFIEADPTSFRAILHFLLYDELPFKDTGFSPAAGHHGGGGLFGGFSGSSNINTRNIEMLYKDSVNLGLKRLSEAMKLFQANFMNSKMDEYRLKIRGYDKTMAAILDIIPAESLFHKTEYTVRIKQDLQTIEEQKCCEHDCKTLTPRLFNGQQYVRNINAIVKVQFEVNPTILSAFAIDFQNRGYTVQGSLEMCVFECKKDVKQSRYIVFDTHKLNCCTEELFLLNFKWDMDTHVVKQQGIFGTKNAAFNQVAQNTGFSFGGKEQNQQSNAGLFGSVQQSNIGSKSPQPENNVSGFGKATGFGSVLQPASFTAGNTGFTNFGGTPQQGAESGNQQLGLFGQSQSFGKVSEPEQQQPLFGQPSQQQGSNLFGSSAFNSQQSTAEAGKNVFGRNQNLTFGQMHQKGSPSSFSFGTPPQKQSTNCGPSFFGKSPSKDQSVFGGKPVFQSSFGFGSPQQQTVTVSPGPSNAKKTTADDKPEGLFGKPSSTAAIIRPGENTLPSEPN